jgi:hypothetical protein
MMMAQWQDRSYFFDEGLQFTCRQCGACCTGAPGTIYVAADEIQLIAKALNLSVTSFTADYLSPYKDSYTIREDHEGRCLFYNEGCAIYRYRPVQCRAFPFWFDNVRSKKRWQEIVGQCPGIGQGRHFTKAEIITLALKTIHL